MAKRFIIGEIVDEEGKLPLRPISNFRDFDTEEAAEKAIEEMCRFHHKPTWYFGVIEI